MKSAGNFSETGLATIPVNPANFPGLNTLGMSFVRADLKAGAINPPHFHPRATEITLCGARKCLFRGLAHFQMNVGDKPSTVFGSFNGQNPGSQKIPTAIFGSGIDDELLEKAFGLSPKQIGMLKEGLIPKG
ncbi:hypothetical protein GH714_030318 [Hevea brasiliensis]|uniref:Germin-like protein n=1 Tax=Hevea brasiliensis TaxID=3981 RepID=A0A6A6M470_HEVBR|nr:hypothetical protein GH714_030318 [Hevea brasiliensis]